MTIFNIRGDGEAENHSIDSARDKPSLSIHDLKTMKVAFERIKTKPQKSSKSLNIQVLDGDKVVEVSIKTKKAFHALFPGSSGAPESLMRQKVMQALTPPGTPIDQSAKPHLTFESWKETLRAEAKAKSPKLYPQLKTAIKSLEELFSEKATSISFQGKALAAKIAKKQLLGPAPHLALELSKLELFYNICHQIHLKAVNAELSPLYIKRLFEMFLNSSSFDSELMVGDNLILSYNPREDQWHIDERGKLVGVGLSFNQEHDVIATPQVSTRTATIMKNSLQALESEHPSQTRFSRKKYSLLGTIEKADKGFIVIPRGEEKKVLGEGREEHSSSGSKSIKVKQAFYIPDSGRVQKVAVKRTSLGNRAIDLTAAQNRSKELKELNSPYTLATPTVLTKPSSTEVSSVVKKSNVFPLFDSDVVDFFSRQSGDLNKKWNGMPQDVLVILYSVAKGLKWVHDLDYIHADIKPENILIALDDTKQISRVVLADFDTAFKEFSTPRALHVTPEFFSVDEVTETGFTKEVDVFALGRTFAEIIPHSSVLAHDEELMDLAERMQRTKPEERPSAYQVVKTLEPILKKYGLDPLKI